MTVFDPHYSTSTCLFGDVLHQLQPPGRGGKFKSYRGMWTREHVTPAGPESIATARLSSFPLLPHLGSRSRLRQGEKGRRGVTVKFPRLRSPIGRHASWACAAEVPVGPPLIRSTTKTTSSPSLAPGCVRLLSEKAMPIGHYPVVHGSFWQPHACLSQTF